MREIVCTDCAEVVEVFELPDEWIDDELYRCGLCLLEPSRARTQLELEVRVDSLLTTAEQRVAYRRGLDVYDRAEAAGKRSRFDPDDPTLRAKKAEAEVAEDACRRYLGLEPATDAYEPDANVGDAVGGWEFRHRSEHWQELPIHPGETKIRRYLLVTGLCPNQVLRGWIEAEDARRVSRPAPWGRGERVVAQSDLRPLSELPRRAETPAYEPAQAAIPF